MKKGTWMISFIFLLLFLVWETFSYVNQNMAFILPAPSHVLVRLWEKSDRFLFHTKITVKEMLIGFLLAFAVAFPLAWMMDLFQSARAFLQPLFIIIQCIPMFTLAPIMIIWFGWSLTAIVIPTALMIFFPLTMNIYQGLRSTPQDLLDYFKVNQATAWQTFFKLKLPWSLPYIFGGFRISAAIAGIAAVAGEWAGAQAGLGVMMVESRRDADLETNFAALVCLTIVSYLLYFITISCEYLVSQRKPLHVVFKNFFIQQRGQAVALLLLIVSGIGLCGCDFKQSKKETRLILDWLPNPNHIPFYVGLNKGFFANQGIQLVIQKLPDSGHTIPYLTSGQCDLALAYMPHTIRVQHKGAPVEPIGILIKEPLNALIYQDEKGIVQPSDLTHKRIGYCNGGKDTAFLDVILKKGQVEPADKRYVGFDLVACLGTNQVDAIYGAYWNIETEHLRSLGVPTKFFKLEEFNVPTYYELIVLAKKESKQCDPHFIKQFQMALQQSIDYAKQHSDEAFAIYSKYQKDKSDKTILWEKEAWKMTIPALAEHQAISQDVWQDFENWLDQHHLL
jgi:ABC-type nitrate/sulfonate/bicarbonate transport system permease component/ABC-type nitrate/sulfonate/bicarbonate transport system substrate-binding protein